MSKFVRDMSRYHVIREDKKITVSNDYTTAVDHFTVKTTECEFNGSRDYLVCDDTSYRVRLYDDTEEGVKQALSEMYDGVLEKSLYRHP